MFDGRGRRRRLWGTKAAARLPAPGPADLPGPVRDAQPEAHHRRLRRRAARSSTASARRARSATPGSPRRSRPPACARRRTSRRRYPHELSGGQRQRVVIAGALVMDPELIVADEPVSMLDVSIRTELLRLMLDLRKERGLTYLFITHDLSLAWVIADRIAVMYLGRIMEIGPAEQVIRSPRNPYTQALVSVSPSPDPPEVGGRGQADDPRRRDARRGRTSRPAAGSTRAARSRSTGAAPRSRRSSRWRRATSRPAGWPRPGRVTCRSSTRSCRTPPPSRGDRGRRGVARRLGARSPDMPTPRPWPGRQRLGSGHAQRATSSAPGCSAG